jgi:hypothetical protein
MTNQSAIPPNDVDSEINGQLTANNSALITPKNQTFLASNTETVYFEEAVY